MKTVSRESAVNPLLGKDFALESNKSIPGRFVFSVVECWFSSGLSHSVFKYFLHFNLCICLSMQMSVGADASTAHMWRSEGS